MDFLESAAVLIPVLTGMALTVYRGEPDTLGQFEAQYCFSAQLQNIYTAQGLGAFCQKGAEDRIYDLEEPMGTRLAAFKAGGQWLLLGPYVETGWSVQAARLLLAGQGASESALPMYKAYRCKLLIVMQELAVRTAFVLAENLGGGARAVETVRTGAQGRHASLTFSERYADAEEVNRRYQLEDRLVEAVSEGDAGKAHRTWKENGKFLSGLRFMSDSRQDQLAQQYNRAKTWQLLFFVFNNTASNIYLSLMGFVNLYAGNVAGLAVMLVSNIMMAARFWDGVTDPIVGFLVDKTNGKFGKFRPFMLLGNLIMLVSVILMFTTTHLMPEGILKVVYWTVIYLIYIIGYTFQNAATRGGQSVLTNDPKQRPMFARIDSIINALLFAGMAMYITDTLVNKYQGFTAELFREVIFTVVAASTDKLATQVRSNSVVGIMLYGIIIGNYKMLSRMSMITLVPSMVLIIIGTSVAARFSSKRATVLFTWCSIVSSALLGAVLIFGDPTQISLEHIGFMTIAFIGLYTLVYGFATINVGLATPMIADCADYELYQSGNYTPALMGTVFGFFDKVISSFASTIVGWFCVLIGYADRFPTQEDPLTSGIFWVTIFLFIGMPILGWITSLIAMKFYPLDKEKMIEIQAKNAALKAKAK